MTTTSGLVALVTGAGRGIGRALAQALAAAGYRVAVNDIDAATAHQTVAAITALGGQAAAFPADVADPGAVRDLVQAVVTHWASLDILINNAGIEPQQSILTLELGDWQRTLAVNLTAPFLTSQAAGRIMQAQGRGGVIVNIASIAGRAFGLRNRAAYVASKQGLIGFTRECAREYAAYGIRVNAVCPGVIVTEMTAHLRENAAMMQKWMEDIPQARLGDPEDVTGVVLFLCSDAARYLTGQAINVDGGKVMS